MVYTLFSYTNRHIYKIRISWLSKKNSKFLDIDECELKIANCGPDEICKNKPGGYTCSCPLGYVLNQSRRCEDQDECKFYKGQVNDFL